MIYITRVLNRPLHKSIIKSCVKERRKSVFITLSLDNCLIPGSNL